METAYFAAGCFWGVQQRYSRLPGVVSTRGGYMGGSREHPDYRTVCSGATGHAETVEVVFDPTVTNYQRLLEHFFQWHDPTQLNRQGPDRGTQYRSALFPQKPTQADEAEAAIEALNSSRQWPRPVVTRIEQATAFWVAEDDHQHYLDKHGLGGCHG